MLILPPAGSLATFCRGHSPVAMIGQASLEADLLAGGLFHGMSVYEFTSGSFSENSGNAELISSLVQRALSPSNRNNQRLLTGTPTGRILLERLGGLGGLQSCEQAAVLKQ